MYDKVVKIYISSKCQDFETVKHILLTFFYDNFTSNILGILKSQARIVSYVVQVCRQRLQQPSWVGSGLAGSQQTSITRLKMRNFLLYTTCLRIKFPEVSCCWTFIYYYRRKLSTSLCLHVVHNDMATFFFLFIVCQDISMNQIKIYLYSILGLFLMLRNIKHLQS